VLAGSVAIVASQVVPKPLPPLVVQQAPGIRPLGSGRHTMWGIRVYDATLWVVGPQYAPSEPHALDVEPGRTVNSDTLVKTATDEMRNLNLGDSARLAAWQNEMKKLIPNLKAGDQVVIFCPQDKRTLVYYNGQSRGAVDDTTLCPAIMSVWLHPESKSKEMRKSLLAQ